MESSIIIALSRQVALRQQMDTIANNMANANTSGFKRQGIMFTEHLEDLRYQENEYSQVLDYGQFTDMEPGPMRQTNNPFDLALDGPGFFGVQTPAGIQYTRAGNFTLSPIGELVTDSGRPVADAGGGTITIPPEATEITITEGGLVSSDQGQHGQLMVVEFQDLQRLDFTGEGLFRTGQPAVPSENTRVRQGLLEGSNVNVISQTTEMITTLRAYQGVQRVGENEHERIRSMIQRLTRQS